MLADARGRGTDRAPSPSASSRARVEPYWLVVAATDDRAVNARVAAAAAAARRFCNVVDDPELCSFIMPAIVDRSPVTIAIGSGGLSPVLARWVKGLIEAWLPQRLGALAELAGRWRERVRAAHRPTRTSAGTSGSASSTAKWPSTCSPAATQTRSARSSARSRLGRSDDAASGAARRTSSAPGPAAPT